MKAVFIAAMVAALVASVAPDAGAARRSTTLQHPIPCFINNGWAVTGTDRNGTATTLDGTATATWVRTAEWFDGRWWLSNLYGVRASWHTLAQVQTIMFCTNHTG